MRFDKYTVKAQEALQAAQQLAARGGHPEVRDIHLLLALLEQPEGIVPPTLRKIGVDPTALAQAGRRAFERIPKVSGAIEEPRIARGLASTLEEAERAASEFKD